jgi:hypothetical protein
MLLESRHSSGITSLNATIWTTYLAHLRQHRRLLAEAVFSHHPNDPLISQDAAWDRTCHKVFSLNREFSGIVIPSHSR